MHWLYKYLEVKYLNLSVLGTAQRPAVDPRAARGGLLARVAEGCGQPADCKPALSWPEPRGPPRVGTLDITQHILLKIRT